MTLEFSHCADISFYTAISEWFSGRTKEVFDLILGVVLNGTVLKFCPLIRSYAKNDLACNVLNFLKPIDYSGRYF